MPDDRDILVLGSGPAGLSLASHCAQKGLKCTVVSPEPLAEWEPNYGLWIDEVEDLAVLEAMYFRWSRPRVWLADEPVELQRTYALLHGARLQQGMHRQGQAAGLEVRAGRVVRVEHGETHSTAHLDDGATLTARLIVDSTGGGTDLIERRRGLAPGFQAAYGQWIQVESHPYADEEMSLMDFRTVPGFDDAEPSFLYAMPVSPTRLFVEETSLVARPGMNIEILKARLQMRLAHMGIQPLKMEKEEICWIPMGLGLPRKEQRLLGFGVAASMVHPSSGYQISRTLACAPALAGVLATALNHGDGATAAAAGWEFLWPRDRERSWKIFTFGMDFLTDLNGAEIRRFFDSFFMLPVDDWRGYLSGTASTRAVTNSMKSFFFLLDPGLRWRIMRASASLRSLPVIQAAVGL